MELLLQLTNTIFISGNQGTFRTIIGSNFGALTAENNSVSDHSFGRGFDIDMVGDTPNGAINLVSSLDAYRRGLDMFLSTLQKLPRELHPDLIIVHDQLASELGILEKNLEDATAAVRVKYKGLSPYINFKADTSHRNHIHISFSAQRAGSFLTPAMIAPVMELPSGEIRTIGNIQLDLFKTNYFDKPNEALTPDEVMFLLSTCGLFSDEVSAIFVGLGQRESNWRPGALNEAKKNGQGDFSFGAFQCNLLPNAHGEKTFMLKYNATGQPFEDSVLGYKLAYAVDSDNNKATLKQKVLDKATKATIDKRIFVPYNQAWMLGTTAAGEIQVAKAASGKLIDSYVFSAWGDYETKTGPRSIVGSIFDVKFSIVLAAYELKGKKEDTLKSWIRKKFKNQKPYDYIEQWMSGTVFNSKRRNSRGLTWQLIIQNLIKK